MSKCAIIDCERQKHTRGWCSMHYKRWLATGDPLEVRIGNYRHGHASASHPSPEYRTWCDMIKRCCYEKNKSYPYYGGRGIKVCVEWRSSFAAFFRDIGAKPSSKYTIDRIDVNGNYEPNNVRWSTKLEQGRNKRSNHLIQIDCRTMCISEWSEISGIGQAIIAGRIRDGWDSKAAVYTPKQRIIR